MCVCVCVFVCFRNKCCNKCCANFFHHQVSCALKIFLDFKHCLESAEPNLSNSGSTPLQTSTTPPVPPSHLLITAKSVHVEYCQVHIECLIALESLGKRFKDVIFKNEIYTLLSHTNHFFCNRLILVTINS